MDGLVDGYKQGFVRCGCFLCIGFFFGFVQVIDQLNGMFCVFMGNGLNGKIQIMFCFQNECKGFFVDGGNYYIVGGGLFIIGQGIIQIVYGDNLVIGNGKQIWVGIVDGNIGLIIVYYWYYGGGQCIVCGYYVVGKKQVVEYYCCIIFFYCLFF